MKAERRGAGRRGQLVVIAPIVLFVVGAICAMTADVGLMFNWRARLQNGADAGVLAAMKVLVRRQLDGAEEADARAAAAAEARRLCALNAPGAGTRIEFGELDGTGGFVPTDSDSPARAARVLAYRRDDAPAGHVRLTFGPLVGVTSCDVAGRAAAHVTANISGTVGGLGPFAIPIGRVVPPGESLAFYPADGDDYNGKGDVSIVPGCWGLLNLNGGALGTKEMVDWILNGYNEPFRIPDGEELWVDGTSGFRVGLQKPMEERIGTSMTMVLYDMVIGAGSQASFRVVGFVRGIITEVDMTGKGAHLTMVVAEIGTYHDLIAGGTVISPNILKIELIE